MKRYLRLTENREAREAEDEIAYHLSMKIEDLVREGHSPESARMEAMRQFGDADKVQAEVAGLVRMRQREERRADMLDALRQDVKYAFRQLRMSPMFAFIAVLTLALGISATVSIFSVVQAVLLRPLPYADADRIMLIGESDDPSRGNPRTTTSYVLFDDLRERIPAFESLAVFDGWSPTLTGAGDPERLKGSFVTAGIFDVFRINPVLGRRMLPSDNVENGPKLVWISWQLWQSRYSGDRNVIGRTMTLNGTAREIAGVLPRDFVPPGGEMATDVWGNNYRDDNDKRGSRYLNIVSRLRPDAVEEQVRAQLRALSIQIAQDDPVHSKDTWIMMFPIRELVIGGNTRGPVLILMLSAAVVLLIACANVSNLLLARGSYRARELSIRAALGTTRGRLVRQLVTESVVLALIGTAVALPAASLSIRVLLRFAPEGIRTQPIGMHPVVLLFSLGAALLAALLFGVFPALRNTRSGVQATLREEGRNATSARAQRVRGALAVTQLSFALALVLSAGLLLKSFRNVLSVDPGIDPRNVFTASLNLPSRYDGEAAPAFLNALNERIKALPGVRSAAVTSIVPLGGSWDRISVDTGNVRDIQDAPEADRYVVSPEYFGTMSVTLKRGRLFDAQDRSGSAPVAVVDEVFARRLRPNGDVLGARLGVPGHDSMATVVGVVRHVKHYGLDAESQGQIYVSHNQYPWRWMHIVARTDGDALALTGQVRATVRSLDSDQPIYDVNTLELHMADRTASRRFVLSLLAAFAGIALGLAAIGLYGVIAYSAAQRRREFGIRLALGATPPMLLRMVMKESAALVVMGISTGLLLAAGGAKVLRGLLFHVSTTDPAVVAGAALLLMLTAAVASWVPARRASGVDPLTSIRAD